jgi:CubicO group peptidase (beta-lactamase class C family)
MISGCLLLLVASVFQASGVRDLSGRSTAQPFPTSTPEEQGMDSELIADAIDYLFSQQELYNIDSLTIVRHGHIVTDITFYPFQPGELHDLASTSKVVMSTLVGIAIDKGYIGSVDDRVVDFFPERDIHNLDERKRRMTVEHLLTMTSALSDGEDIECTRTSVGCALDLPMVGEPGEVYAYFWAPPVLLSGILQATAGMNAGEFARVHLFEPLGITNAVWEVSWPDQTKANGYLKLTPHDLAKFGQMILQRGMWNGRRVVSEEWIEQATAIQFSDFYGYFWGHYPEFPQFVTGGGAMGQRLVISPEDDLVVVYMGFGYAQEDIEDIYLETLRSHILPAVQFDGALPPNPAGVARIADQIELAATNTRDPAPVAPLPSIAHEISGQTYVLDLESGYVELSLDFSREEEVWMSVSATADAVEGAPFTWAAGLDGYDRFADGRYGLLAAATGVWEDEDTFVANVECLGILMLFRLTFDFDGDELSLLVEDLWWWEPEEPFTWTGRIKGTGPPSPIERFVSGLFRRSEGIAFNGEGDLFVTADRALWRLSPDGEVEWIADLHSNLGVAPIGDRDLLVADWGPIHAFDHGPNDDGMVWRVTPEGEATVVATGIGDPNFLLVRDEGSILVSDDGTHEIWTVDGNGFEEIFSGSIGHPNGMVVSPDGNTLYVAQTFSSVDPVVWDNRVWSLPLANGEPAGDPVLLCETENAEGADGLAMDEDGHIYVAANVAGKILRVDPSDGSVEVVAEGLPGVASLAFGRGEYGETSLYATSTRTGVVWKIEVGVAGARVGDTRESRTWSSRSFRAAR